jgi:Na+/proline symporter
MNIIDFSFDPKARYNFWSGMLGGTFLFISYFGTDQSQVQRYLSGKTLTESRLGLLFNGILKVPMQFTVLFVGMMVFVFYQFNSSPLHFNSDNIRRLQASPYAAELSALESRHQQVFEQKRAGIYEMISANREHNAEKLQEAKSRVQGFIAEDQSLRKETEKLVKANTPSAETKDTDYVFITFVMNHLPVGIIGLLIAVIFAAAMSSIAAEINALATTTVVDIYRRLFVPNAADKHYFGASISFTIFWGLVALGFAGLASLFDNLIQAINIIGSLFYGVILGIFLVAFFFKQVRGNAVFSAAVLSEMCIIALFFGDKMGYFSLGFLWLNLIGPALVIGISVLFQHLIFNGIERKKAQIL